MSTAFPETRWTMVLRLRAVDDTQRRRAFADLCETYWQPLYVSARSLGHSPHDAEDLVQGFIAQLLERDDLGPLGPERGRMRAFFKVAFRNFVVDQVRHLNARRRGEGGVLLRIDFTAVERELLTGESPDAAYDRQWTRVLLARSLEQLRVKYDARGKAALFAELEPFLSEKSPTNYHELAAKLGRSEVGLRAAVHRLREQFGAVLRAEVAETLAPGEDIDAELRQLLAGAE